jgi:hypothetical protein
METRQRKERWNDQKKYEKVKNPPLLVKGFILFIV